MALVAISARQLLEWLVPRSCWHTQGPYPTNYDRRSRTQAADRTMALPGDRVGSDRCGSESLKHFSRKEHDERKHSNPRWMCDRVAPWLKDAEFENGPIPLGALCPRSDA